MPPTKKVIAIQMRKVLSVRSTTLSAPQNGGEMIIQAMKIGTSMVARCRP